MIVNQSYMINFSSYVYAALMGRVSLERVIKYFFFKAIIIIASFNNKEIQNYTLVIYIILTFIPFSLTLFNINLLYIYLSLIFYTLIVSF